MKILGYVDDGITWLVEYQKNIVGDWYLVFLILELICIFWLIFYFLSPKGEVRGMP
jgi:hypothetical protein